MRKILVVLYLFVASVTNSFVMALQQTSITGPINGYTGANILYLMRRHYLMENKRFQNCGHQSRRIFDSYMEKGYA